MRVQIAAGHAGLWGGVSCGSCPAGAGLLERVSAALDADLIVEIAPHAA